VYSASLLVKLGKSKSLYVFNEKKKVWDVINHKNSEIGKIKEIVMVEIMNQCDEFLPAYKEQIDNLNKKMSETDDDDEKEEIIAEIEIATTEQSAISKTRTNIQYNKYVKDVVDVCIHNLMDDDIEAILDKSPDVLPIKNGLLIHLDTGIVRQRTINDFFTFECPVSYQPQINNYEHITRFFNNITNNDAEYTRYLQKYLGYCLTGRITDRTFVISHGEGANGKSSVYEGLMANILSEFYQSVSGDAFAEKHEKSGGGRATPELMALAKARLAVFSEGDKETEINDAKVKNLTGKDTIVARELYKGEIRFKTQAKLNILTNPKPKINVNDKAMKARFRLHPYNVVFDLNDLEGKRFVEDIQDKWLNESFSWIVDGAIEWYKTGVLQPAKICIDHQQEYIRELDSVGLWVNERCEMGDDDHTYFIKPMLAFEDFERFCGNYGHEKLKQKDFFNVFKTKCNNKKNKKIDGSSCLCYFGIRLKEDNEKLNPVFNWA